MRRAVIWFSIRNRRRKAARISAWMDERGCGTVLLVGACGRGWYANEDVVEDAVIRGRQVLMGFNVYPVEGTPYPFTVADAREMPFEDQYADFALANAIIEHVGDEVDQLRMVAEMCRVARSWVITTPNRWFPVESHTSTMFKHWLPGWRAQQPKFTRLLSRREFADLAPDARIEGHWWSPTFTAYWARPTAASTTTRTELSADSWPSSTSWRQSG